ncbi:MAG: Ig-like domain-containing protein [Gemmatimonadota bacterium]
MLLATASIMACGGGEGGGGTPTPPPQARLLSKMDGDLQTGAVGTALPVTPRVRVATSGGAAAAGVQVTFVVSAGGGSIGQTTATTDAAGEASPGSWSLGQTPGENTITASVSGATPTSVSFTATATPGPPSQLAKVAGDNQRAVSQFPVGTRPSVRVADRFNNPVSGATVTFAVTAGSGTVTGGSQTTGNDGVATAGGWTLGSVGVNSLSATVAGAAVPAAVFTATGDELLLSPAVDTVLSGTVRATRLVIGAGRTITATTALTLIVDSTITINGTLRGLCVPVTVIARRSINVTGTVNNTCAAADDNAPDLRIIAGSDYTFTNATVTSTGDFEITNDTTLTDASFLMIASGGRFATGRATGRQSAANPICAIGGGSYPILPRNARTGNAGRNGNPGGTGRNVRITCRGDLVITGGSSIEAQNGGNGGDGTDNTNRPASASGGHGGPGGDVRIRATGVLSIADASISGGIGGFGGDALAVGQPGAFGSRGTDATARGGDGDEGGTFDLRAGVEIQMQASSRFAVGRGGPGGIAAARGADGVAVSSGPAQAGGHAKAEGGNGGSSRDKQLRAANVLGLQLAQLAGGEGGLGGPATATGGRGGPGHEGSRDGGDGGDVEAIGGTGGDARLRGLNGAPFARGGHGGGAAFAGGIGADGWSNSCTLPLGFTEGGNGGDGGTVRGRDGVGGTGSSSGAAGDVRVAARTGDAGTGGKGEPHGTTGAVFDRIARNGTRTNESPAGFTRRVPFPCVNFGPASIDTPYQSNNVLCSSPSLIRALSIGNFGAVPVQAAVMAVDPAGIFSGAYAFDAASNNPSPWTFPPDNATTGAGPRINVAPICGGFVTPIFTCIRITAVLGSTAVYDYIPFRTRLAGTPRDEAADIAACAALP